MMSGDRKLSADSFPTARTQNQGARSAFTDEVRAYISTQQARKLFGVVFHSYRTGLEEEDLVQDMVVRCLEQSHHFHGGNVEAWARTVAHRVVLNELRKPRNKRPHDEYNDRVKLTNGFERTKNVYDRPDLLAEAIDLAREMWDGAGEDDRAIVRALIQHQGSAVEMSRALGRNKHTMSGARRRQRQRFNSLLKG